MKTVQTLVNATKEMKQGNHRVSFSQNELGIQGKAFYYYDTIICSTNEPKRLFSIDSSYGTQSTTRACNAYRKHYESLGYTEVK